MKTAECKDRPRLLVASILCCWSVLFGGMVWADQIVGYLKTDCLGDGAQSRDTVVSVPFQSHGAFQGQLSSVDLQAGQSTLNFGSTIGAADDFANSPHFVLFKSGAAAGRMFSITSNTATSVVIDTGSETLSGVAAGNIAQIVPHWTLDTLLPPDTQSTIHESSGVLPTQRASEVLLFDTTSEGILLSPDRVFFVTASGWKQVGEGYPDAGNTVLAPGSGMVIRHAAGAAGTEFISHGVVEEADVATVLRSRSEGPQDNTVSLLRPIPTKLEDLDLESYFTLSASNDAGDRQDELFVFGTTLGTVNTFPTAKYFRTASGWIEDDGSTYPVSNDTEIPAGSAFVIRKASSGGGNQIWVNAARY